MLGVRETVPLLARDRRGSGREEPPGENWTATDARLVPEQIAAAALPTDLDGIRGSKLGPRARPRTDSPANKDLRSEMTHQ